ncbi:D-ribose pyranase [Seleniivibrio woodruffii]|uniref:D-ribose pyranase n=1 Tax=Seleniivibrio woodruffii TaxID=1078050 RepID=A0A4R1KCV1_9BACT|nr:D-ribose pyranase [Seleniivibrio woodruffii]TCK61987.1 ribose transport protein RbsD [Seleniivibrio woodruffii]TVZ34896.1 D-ribose pyranase [Seleniivibrio woodruffii]
MKKGTLLNSRISAVISEMGHTDTIVIADAGLPIPAGVERIDLAVHAGLPDFVSVLKTVLSELKVEEATIAFEIAEKNPSVYQAIQELTKDVKINIVCHEEFKSITKRAKAVVRTGECTPYANIILHSGVVF